MNLELQLRDTEIMKIAFECRAISFDQIHRHFFTGSAKATARRRISQLEKHGFIKTTPFKRGSAVYKYISVMPKSLSCFTEEWDFDIDQPHFRTESPTHDIHLAEVLFRLRRLKSFHSCLTENVLQSSSELAGKPGFSALIRLQADGALRLIDAEGDFHLFGLEIEVSKKEPERYIKKLAGYYAADGIDGVIYICGSQEIASAIARANADLCKNQDSLLFMGLEADVLSSKNEIHLSNQLTKGIRLV